MAFQRDTESTDFRRPGPLPVDPESAFGGTVPPAQQPIVSSLDRDPPGASLLGLSAEEIAQFKQSGFLIKRGLIPPSEFAQFLELWWQQPPVLAAGVTRNEPSSWVAPGKHWPDENRWALANDWMGTGAWPSPTDERQGAEVGERVGRLPHRLTSGYVNDVWRWHGLGHDEEFVAATSAHPNVLYMAEALMGGPVKRPRRNRGIYSIFPRDPAGEESKLGPHMDQNMAELIVVTYLDDVDPQSGGFTIWPTSSQALYPTSEQAFNWVATDRSTAVFDDVMTNVAPLEFVGKAGDVIFCHGLTIHSGGIHETGKVRLAVIQDLNRVQPRSHMRWTAAGKHGGPRINCSMDGVFDFTGEGSDDPSDGLREVTNQWIMDSNEFVLARHAPLVDMFEDWNLGEHSVTGDVVDEPAWWEKYRLPMLPTGDVPRGGGGMPAVALADIADYKGEGIWQAESRANDWMKS